MRGPALPEHFVVTDIQPAPNNFAGATLATTGSFHQVSAAKPIVLVDQGGHWLITHDTAMIALDAFDIGVARLVLHFLIQFPDARDCHGSGDS